VSVRYLYGDRNRPINTRQDCRECGFLAWTLSAESDSCHCEVCDLRGHVRDTATERDAARGRIKELEEKLVEVERQWSRSVRLPMSERLVNLTEPEPEDVSFAAESTTGEQAQNLSVFAKWDGCVTVRRKYERGFDNIHICDINHFIAFLEAVRDEGVRRYPDEWAMPEGK
jgi:hypothetical protein